MMYDFSRTIAMICTISLAYHGHWIWAVFFGVYALGNISIELESKGIIGK